MELDCARSGECIQTSISGDDRKISAKHQLTAAELEKIFLQWPFYPNFYLEAQDQSGRSRSSPRRSRSSPLRSK